MLKLRLNKLTHSIFSDEVQKGLYDKYIQMQEHEGFKHFLLPYLLMLRGYMAEDVLSEKFSRLEPYEKDVNQRAYALCSDLILWIIQPDAQARRLARIKTHNLKMGEKHKASITPIRRSHK